jgi:outer membrane protein TolC
MSLKECLELANKNNRSLKLARYDSGIQAENVSIAESGYYPRVDLQAGFTALLDPQAIKTPAASFETQQSSFPYASAGLYQTLYDFGRRDRRKEQAVLQESAVSSGTGSLRQDVSLQAIRGYYGILQSMRVVDAAKDEVSQREQHLKMATTLYEEGVTTRNDLLQAEVKLAGSRQRLLSENNRLTNSWLFLNYLTGNPSEYRSILSEEGGFETPAGEVDRTLLDKRDEIAAQKSMIKLSEAYLEESRSEFYPELFLKAGIEYLQNDKVVEQTVASATVGIKMNLFDGMATTSRQRQAVKLLEKEKERLRGMEDAFLLEIKSARNDLGVASERVEVAKAAIRQSEENLRINSDRYKAQIGTATEVIDAQTLLSQTRSDYFQALFDYQVSKARVKRALGEL